MDAGWSSPVARQAHNLKAAGSNPAPATNDPTHFSGTAVLVTWSYGHGAFYPLDRRNKGKRLACHVWRAAR